MKLTQEQTQYIFDYVSSFDIKWYELQVELTDHMVSSMEEIWEKDPELTFHQVKQYAENKFTGDSSFKSIEKEQTKVLRKEYNREQWKMIAAYLKFPKIFGSVLLVFITYQASFYFDDLSKFFGYLFMSLILFLIQPTYSFIKSRKTHKKRFLTIETNYSVTISTVLFLNLAAGLKNMFEDELRLYPIVVLLFCCLWVLQLLFFITGNYIIKKTIERVKKQYQLA